jgi:two-component system cell cycle sensor histidine kinase/response regulator CckA
MKQKNAARSAADEGKQEIYVVDDEPMLLELASVILQPLGYSVKTFRNPDAAIQAYTDARPRPDLLITDYAMHLMNGMDLLRACRKVQPRQKILLVSGTVGEEVFKTSPVKPDAFLRKPYYAKQLVDTVQGMMANSARV